MSLNKQGIPKPCETSVYWQCWHAGGARDVIGAPKRSYFGPLLPLCIRMFRE